jgi:hypothetical protein
LAERDAGIHHLSHAQAGDDYMKHPEHPHFSAAWKHPAVLIDA